MRRLLPIALLFFAVSGTPALAGTVKGDFNGDGFSELAIGAPYESVGSVSDAGAVTVVYGASGGLRNSALNQTFTEGSSGLPDSAETGDFFGWSLATGDFNGDGYADLAIGAPYEDVTVNGLPPIIPDTTYSDMGVVEIVYGSAGGLNSLSAPAPVLLARDAVDYDNYDKFGYALAAANFGNGSPADLAVGSPFDNTGTTSDNGTVSLFYGHTGGIDAIPSAVLAKSDPEILGDAGDGENFGVALAAANFGKSGQADLAIGVGRNLPGGSVNVLYGSPAGIVTTGNQRWTQDSPGIADQSEQPDHFGSALAAGDFGRSSHADLAIGAPCEKLGGAACAGGVNVIFGSKTGLSARGDQFWSQNSLGIADKAEQNDLFGLALTAANFGKSGRADLAVGSWETIGTQSWAGSVEVLYGTAGGLTAAGSQRWSQATAGVNTQPGIYDFFGQTLGAGNFGRGGYADLAIGAPGEDFDDLGSAGAVEVLYGTAYGLRVRNDDFLQQDDLSSSDGPEPTDYFGFSLAPRPSSYGSYWFE